MPEWFFALETVRMLTVVVTATIVAVARIFRVLFIDLSFHDLRFGLNVKPPPRSPGLQTIPRTSTAIPERQTSGPKLLRPEAVHPCLEPLRPLSKPGRRGEREGTNRSLDVGRDAVMLVSIVTGEGVGDDDIGPVLGIAIGVVGCRRTGRRCRGLLLPGG